MSMDEGSSTVFVVLSNPAMSEAPRCPPSVLSAELVLTAAKTGGVLSAAAEVLGEARALLPLSWLPAAW